MGARKGRCLENHNYILSYKVVALYRLDILFRLGVPLLELSCPFGTDYIFHVIRLKGQKFLSLPLPQWPPHLI